MRIGSLCTGYGGLDQAVQQVTGGTLAWVSDNEPGPTALLERLHPGVPNLGDFTAIDWSTVEPVDVIVAGYPCQPYSAAGKKKGNEDERAIFPAVAGAIRHLGPRLAFLENVRGHLNRGFDSVLGALADIGYDAQWRCLRASDAGAPHRRERLFIVAWPAADAPGVGRDRCPWSDTKPHRDGQRPSRVDADRLAIGWGPYEPAIRRWEQLTRPAPAPTERGAKGQPRLPPAFVEWLMGLPEGHVTGVPGLTRNQQLKLLGNGVVPQQAAAAYSALLATIEDEEFIAA